MSDSLQPHELQHARPPCPSQTPGVYSNSCPSSQWCHPAISSSVVPFSSCPQPLPASGSFPTSQLFSWGSQNIGVSVSASVLPMNTQDWSPLRWTGWISLQSDLNSATLIPLHQGVRTWSLGELYSADHDNTVSIWLVYFWPQDHALQGSKYHWEYLSPSIKSSSPTFWWVPQSLLFPCQ